MGKHPDRRERFPSRIALALLSRVDQQDPLVAPLRQMLADVRSRPTPAPTRVTRWMREARRRFFALADADWFERVVVVVFALWALTTLVEIVALIVLAKFGLPSEEVFRVRHPIVNHGLGNGQHDFIQWLSFAASLVATGFVVAGLVDARKGLRPR